MFTIQFNFVYNYWHIFRYVIKEFQETHSQDLNNDGENFRNWAYYYASVNSIKAANYTFITYAFQAQLPFS